MARWMISRELLVALTVSVGIHAVWLVREAKASSKPAASISEVTLETEVRPPPPPEAAPLPTPTNAPPEPVAQRVPARSAAAAAKALPAAAQAGRTLTAPEQSDPTQTADFTMVQGMGTAYVGGTTSTVGMNRVAVQGPASDQPSPVQRAVVTPTGEALRDRSRSATPVSPAWDCSRLFPSGADVGDYATVLIAVSVGADGAAKRVAMLRDPGHGFGAAAVQCAMGQRFNVALDRLGSPVAATTPPIVVRFSR